MQVIGSNTVFPENIPQLSLQSILNLESIVSKEGYVRVIVNFRNKGLTLYVRKDFTGWQGLPVFKTSMAV
jgi:hypothetical protein